MSSLGVLVSLRAVLGAVQTAWLSRWGMCRMKLNSHFWPICYVEPSARRPPATYVSSTRVLGFFFHVFINVFKKKSDGWVLNSPPQRALRHAVEVEVKQFGQHQDHLHSNTKADTVTQLLEWWQRSRCFELSAVDHVIIWWFLEFFILFFLWPHTSLTPTFITVPSIYSS